MLDDVRGVTPLAGMTRADFLKAAGAAGVLVTASGTVLSVVGGAAQAQSTIGEFGPLFVESHIYYPKYFVKRNSEKDVRVRSDEECISPPDDEFEDRQFCKPAAGTNGLLPDGRFLFANAIEGSEDSKAFGFDADKSVEDAQSRVIKFNYNDNTSSKFLKPFRATGGVRNEPVSELIPGATIGSNRRGNNGSFFCASQCHLPNGSLLIVGGTQWYQESAGSGEDFVELEGLSAARFFDYKINKWVLLRDMNFGRWYPAVVPLANGDPLVVGGVHKLEKPIYLPPQEPGEPPFSDSGGNVRQVERLNLKTGQWEQQGESARRSLPLQPRIHLLPNGHVVFNGSGQAFSPNGQDPLQPTWNITATFNPETKTWTDHGVAGTGCSEPFNIGSKLSTHEVPLLLEKNESGDYSTFEILCGGGTHGLGIITNPGSFFANNQSRISTFVVDGDTITVTHADTGDMFSSGDAPANMEDPPLPSGTGGTPLGRWYGDAVLLPDGKVFVSSGADRDEVFFPGNEFPILECEVFDREDTTDHPNGSWSVVGSQTNARTYHNTNSLLATGEVIIGGHAPIPFGYVSHDSDTIPNNRNDDGRDPTFQIYSPEYVGDPNRPVIDVARNGEKDPLSAKTGGNLVIPTSTSGIDDVVIMRLPSTTHINDTEQRGLVLSDITQNATSVTATMPKTLAEYGGPGFCLAFIRKNGLPSEGVFVQVKK